jgi:hypothetical protein
MERIVLIVDQLEEVRRLIQAGSLSHLRMALLLLDNASEVIMYRRIATILKYSEWNERILEQARQVMSKEKLAEFQQERNIRTLSGKKRRALLREYAAKVDFLVSIRGELPKALGDVLKAIHENRNEAYHRDKIRKDTLRSAVLVLYDITADLLTRLRPGGISYSGTDDWTGFCQRYGLKGPSGFLGEGGLERIAAQLRAGVHLDAHDLAQGLANHLAERVDSIERAIAFVAENAIGELTLEQELKRIQFWAEHGEVPPDSKDSRFLSYTARYSMQDLARWRAGSRALIEYTDKLELFGAFARTEVEVEDLEEKVYEVEAIMDQAIQQEIDLRRGK